MPANTLLTNSRPKNYDARRRTLAALVVAVVVALCTVGRLSREVQLITVWNSFALTTLALAWLRIITSDALTAVRTAQIQDTSRAAIFSVVVIGALASLAAVVGVLATAKAFHGRVFLTHILLAIGTVVCSWTLLHTIFALHYAHLYYRRNDDGRDGDDRDDEGGDGLEFPNTKRPDFLDFTYFSFVIGMTFQVSDVQITSPSIRRLALVHGLLSFLFNTVILALTINLASGLLTPGS
jgi:uncharacterized membrane protein